MKKTVEALPMSRRTLLVATGLVLLVPASGRLVPTAVAAPPRLSQGYGHGYTGGY